MDVSRPPSVLFSPHAVASSAVAALTPAPTHISPLSSPRDSSAGSTNGPPVCIPGQHFRVGGAREYLYTPHFIFLLDNRKVSVVSTSLAEIAARSVYQDSDVGTAASIFGRTVASSSATEPSTPSQKKETPRTPTGASTTETPTHDHRTSPSQRATAFAPTLVPSDMHHFGAFPATPTLSSSGPSSSTQKDTQNDFKGGALPPFLPPVSSNIRDMKRSRIDIDEMKSQGPESFSGAAGGMGRKEADLLAECEQAVVQELRLPYEQKLCGIFGLEYVMDSVDGHPAFNTSELRKLAPKTNSSENVVVGHVKVGTLSTLSLLTFHSFICRIVRLWLRKLRVSSAEVARVCGDW